MQVPLSGYAAAQTAKVKNKTHSSLHDVSRDGRADDAWQGGYSVAQTHEYTGILWSYVQMVDTRKHNNFIT